jgi:hypothetical protein
MSVISIIAIIIAIHSGIMIAIISFHPGWYISKALAAGVEPNISNAIKIKAILAGVAAAIAVYFW